MVFLLGNEVHNGRYIDLLESSNALGDDSNSDGERDRHSVRQIFKRTDLSQTFELTKIQAFSHSTQQGVRHTDGQTFISRRTATPTYILKDRRTYIQSDRLIFRVTNRRTEGHSFRKTTIQTDSNTDKQKDIHSVRNIFRNKDGQTEKYTSRQIYRWTDTWTDIQSDRHSEKPNDRNTVTQTFRRTEEETNIQTNIQTDRKTDIGADRHSEGQTYRHSDRQQDRHRGRKNREIDAYMRQTFRRI